MVEIGFSMDEGLPVCIAVVVVSIWLLEVVTKKKGDKMMEN